MHVGLLAFPMVTQLDLMGPLQVLTRLPGATVHVVAASSAPVPTDCGVGLVPTATFDTCPQLQVLIVPGGPGVRDALQDRATLAFVREQGASARYVGSVCTGAFVLGVAGLLRGRRAATHWAYRHLLPLVGALPEARRVVWDGPVVTGGGVTAGIDFGLALLAELAGPEVAQQVQLGLEYDPAPPFRTGSPEQAPAEVHNAVLSGYAERLASFEIAVRSALS